ncbi:MAG TPA: A24 family peptidase [Polyangiaceae bacterium]|nr:A24 family peptidase [Polyangiaceae bacterium]
MTPTQVVLLGLLATTATASYFDVRTRHIPNRMLVATGSVGVALHFGAYAVLAHEAGGDWLAAAGSAAANIAAGVLVCAFVPVLLFRFGAMGGGDVKLLAVVGALSGPVLGAQIELYAFLLAALYAPLRLAFQGQLLRLLGNSAVLVTNVFLPKERRRPLPTELLSELCFAPSVLASTVLVAFLRWGSR